MDPAAVADMQVQQESTSRSRICTIIAVMACIVMGCFLLLGFSLKRNDELVAILDQYREYLNQQSMQSPPVVASAPQAAMEPVQVKRPIPRANNTRADEVQVVYLNAPSATPTVTRRRAVSDTTSSSRAMPAIVKSSNAARIQEQQLANDSAYMVADNSSATGLLATERADTHGENVSEPPIPDDRVGGLRSNETWNSENNETANSSAAVQQAASQTTEQVTSQTTKHQATSQTTGQQATSPSSSVSTQTVSTRTVSTQTVSTQTVSTQTVSTQTVPTETNSTPTVSSKTISTQAVSTQTVSTKTVPTETFSTPTVSSKTISTQAVSPQTVSTKAVSTETVPTHTVSTQTVVTQRNGTAKAELQELVDSQLTKGRDESDEEDASSDTEEEVDGTLITDNSRKESKSLILPKSDVPPSNMVVLIVATFFAAWTPYAVLCLWAVFGNVASVPHLVAVLPPLFCKTASAINPFIYFMSNPRVRADVYALLTCRCRTMGRRSCSIEEDYC